MNPLYTSAVPISGTAVAPWPAGSSAEETPTADPGRREQHVGLRRPWSGGQRGCERQAHHEPAAVALVGHRDLTLVRLDDPAGDGKPQPGRTVSARWPRRLPAEGGVEDARQIRVRGTGRVLAPPPAAA